jgi:hypothetical protein
MSRVTSNQVVWVGLCQADILAAGSEASGFEHGQASIKHSLVQSTLKNEKEKIKGQ